MSSNNEEYENSIIETEIESEIKNDVISPDKIETIYFNEAEVTDYTRNVEKLINTFYTKYNANYIIPCGKNKSPITAHKDGSYDWSKIYNEDDHIVFTKDGYVGIILKDLMVIDIDDKSLVTNWENMFPILKTVVSAETKKGKHYYFKRTELADAYKIYDKARCLMINDKKIELDIKTLCETGTGGIIIASPSPEKSWIINPTDTDILDIPQDLLIYINKYYIHKSQKVNPSLTKKDLKQIQINEELKDKQEYSEDDISILVDMLSDSRVNDYNDWLNVGFCLKNISNNTDTNYPIFDNWSKKGKKYDSVKNMRIWRSMPSDKKNSYSLGSLKYWARQDSKKEYELYKKKNLKSRLYSSISTKADLDFAEVFYYMYPNDYITIKNEMYVFKNHYWKKEGENDLYLNLINVIPKLYDELKKEIQIEIDELTERIKNGEKVEEGEENIISKQLLIEEINKTKMFLIVI
jgi:hypothetical protein